MKTLLITLLLSISIFGQSGKSVLTQAQKDSINAMISLAISDSLGYVTPQSFGAVGDGVENDSSAFSQALATGKDVMVSSGTYIIGKQKFYKQGQRLIIGGINNPDNTVQIILRPTIYTDTLFTINKQNCSIEGGFWTTNISSTSNFKTFFAFRTGCDFSALKDVQIYLYAPVEDTISCVNIVDPTNSLLFEHNAFSGYTHGFKIDGYCHNTTIRETKVGRQWGYAIWFNNTQDIYTFNIINSDIESSGVSASVDHTTIQIDGSVYELRLWGNYFESNFTNGSRLLNIQASSSIDIDGVYNWGNHLTDYFIDWDSTASIDLTLRNTRMQQLNEGWFSEPLYPNKTVKIEGNNTIIDDGSPTLSGRKLATGNLIWDDTLQVPMGDLYYDSTGTLKRKYTGFAYRELTAGVVTIDTTINFNSDVESIPSDNIPRISLVGGEIVASDNENNQVTLTDIPTYRSGRAEIATGDTSIVVYHQVGGSEELVSLQDILLTPISNFEGVPYWIDQYSVNDSTFEIKIDTVGHPIDTTMEFGWQVNRSKWRTYNLFDDFSDEDYTASPVWTVASGSFSVNTVGTGGYDGASNYLRCDTAGIISTPSTDAYGVWEFDYYRGIGSNEPAIAFIGQSIASLPNGYSLYISSSSQLYLKEVTDNLFGTDALYISNLVWYRFRIVRSVDGVFSVYIKGGAYGTTFTLVADLLTGANPVTDNTFTTSSYFVMDLDVADRITNIKVY